MNKKLHKYVNEIIDLGTAANMGWKEGVNMFLANVKNAGQEGAPHYGVAVRKRVRLRHLFNYWMCLTRQNRVTNELFLIVLAANMLYIVVLR